MILQRHHVLSAPPHPPTLTAVRPAGPRPRAQPCYLGGAKKACAIGPEPLNIYSGLQALLSRSNRLDSNLAAESFTSRRWWRWWWGEETGGGDRGGNQKTLNLFVVFICFGFSFFSPAPSSHALTRQGRRHPAKAEQAAELCIFFTIVSVVAGNPHKIELFSCVLLLLLI